MPPPCSEPGHNNSGNSKCGHGFCYQNHRRIGGIHRRSASFVLSGSGVPSTSYFCTDLSRTSSASVALSARLLHRTAGIWAYRDLPLLPEDVCGSRILQNLPADPALLRSAYIHGLFPAVNVYSLSVLLSLLPPYMQKTHRTLQFVSIRWVINEFIGVRF